MHNFFIALWLFAAGSLSQVSAQPFDEVSSGRAIEFDGIDDYINLGDKYDDLSLPLTISAWVKVASGETYAFPIFNSQDNLPIYNGFTFAVSATAVSIQYGDGRGEDNPAFRRGKSASIPNISGRWVHLTAVMRAESDMDLYLNGINIGGQYSGSSDLPMASMFANDDAKIGYWFSNGITTKFKGLMDELRIFSRSLSEKEIRDQMCIKLKGNEPSLIGYWTFDETSGNVLKDKSQNHFDGAIAGNPNRVFSGAPIGDEGLHLYTNNWSNKSLRLDYIEAFNIQGNPQGIHIYKVTDTPSQTNGLDTADPNKPYYGVFIASLDVGNFFDMRKNLSCKTFKRSDNTEDLWTDLTIYTSILERKEIISPFVEEMQDLDLGADRIFCDLASYTLTSGINNLSNTTFLWSTGETTSSITVSLSGTYALKVTGTCMEEQDTIKLAFVNTPPLFSLGEDQQLCVLNGKVLKPYKGPTEFEFQWQDGSSSDSLKIIDFGSYWVQVKSKCGVVGDTVTISKKESSLDKLPNIITPNGDKLNEVFAIHPETSVPSRILIYNRWGQIVYINSNYQNDWDGSGLSTGVYFYQVQSDCVGEIKGNVTISR
jgi:gliding motility-associated-like protein